MKLKTLLLGSAAALIAVSGARAADAVVAEPEPMEYVKVCDMYGAGFFYIPGTETCMNINGYVRTDLHYFEDDSTGASDVDFRYRVRLNFDVRNETDWGTLRSQARLQGDSAGAADAAVGIDRALISLAGFRIGYSDSYWTTAHGYGFPGAENGGLYGFDQSVFIDYTYSANGFSLTAGVAETDGPDTAAAVGIVGGAPAVVPATQNDKIDAYAGITYAGSWGSLAATYYYDASAVDQDAYKVSATITAIENLTLKGWYTSHDNGNHVYTRGGAGADASYGVGAAYQATGELQLYAGWTDHDTNTANTDASYVTIGANWSPVTGLTIQPEVILYGNDDTQGLFRVVRSW